MAYKDVRGRGCRG